MTYTLPAGNYRRVIFETEIPIADLSATGTEFHLYGEGCISLPLSGSVMDMGLEPCEFKRPPRTVARMDATEHSFRATDALV